MRLEAVERQKQTTPNRRRVIVMAVAAVLACGCLAVWWRHHRINEALTNLELAVGPGKTAIVQRQKLNGLSVQWPPSIDVFVYSSEPYGMRWWNGDRPSPLARIDDVSITSVALSEPVLDSLQALPDLESIKLWYTDLDPRAAREIAKCAGVSHVSVHRTGLTQDSLRELIQLPELEYLYIESESAIGDNALGELFNARRLNWLSLHGVPRVSPEGVAQLKNHKSLKELTLDGPSFNDSYLDALLSLRSLKRLTLYSNTGFSTEGAARLRRHQGLEEFKQFESW